MYWARSGADSSPSALCASVAGQKSGHPGNAGHHGSNAVKRRGKPIVRSCFALEHALSFAETG
jgi:hypothetical protein